MAVTWGLDPKAKAISVYYEGTDTIYEGQLLCYNHDTTDNWMGVSSADLDTESDTTAEGYQNEGKFIRVEKPSIDNKRFPAGVIVGNASGFAGPGKVDIYVLNGAIVPVWTDRSVVINEKAYLEPSAYTVPNDNVADGVCIGYFVETVDRSSTAGIVLCKLQQPDLASIADASTLGIGLSPLLWGDCPVEEIKKDFGNGFLYEDDYLDLEIEPAASGISDTTVPGWVVTRLTAGGMGSIIGSGGALHMLAAATTDQGLQAQKFNACVLPVAGTNIWFEARVQISHVDNLIFVGIADADTTLIAAGVLDETNVESVGFFTDQNSTTLLGGTITQKTGVPDVTENIIDVAATTWTTLGFKITGVEKVEFYQDGVLVETGVTAASIPAAEMAYSLVCQNQDGAAINTLKVDWVRLVQDVRV